MSELEHEQPDGEQPDEENGEPTDGQDDEQTGEPTVPVEQPAAMSERQMEQAFKKLDSEATRHRNRLSEIMGEDAQTLEPCPCCEPSMAGFMFPVGVAPITDEKRDAILELLGEQQAEGLVDDPGYEQCGVCEGWGETLSGSKTLAHRRKLCDRCGGNGYVPRGTNQSNVVPLQPAAYDPPYSTTNQAAAAAPPDNWGRPPGHPHYGIEPQFVTG